MQVIVSAVTKFAYNFYFNATSFVNMREKVLNLFFTLQVLFLICLYDIATSSFTLVIACHK